MTLYLLAICYEVSETFPASVFRVVEAETLNVLFTTVCKHYVLFADKISLVKKETRGVVGHPVGTKFLSLYIMYI
jgi:hypothetical protein